MLGEKCQLTKWLCQQLVDGRAWQVQKVIKRIMDGVSCVAWQEYAKVERSWDEYSVTQRMYTERHT